VKVGIGLPTTVKGVRGKQLTEWARRAEAAGFDSLATMDGPPRPGLDHGRRADFCVQRGARETRRCVSRGRPGRATARARRRLLLARRGRRSRGAARRGLGAYFAAEPELAEPIIAGALTDAGAIRETLEEFERRGCDDFLFFPASADPAQVDLLAAAVG
jgi:hypothetical protein